MASARHEKIEPSRDDALEATEQRRTGDGRIHGPPPGPASTRRRRSCERPTASMAEDRPRRRGRTRRQSSGTTSGPPPEIALDGQRVDHPLPRREWPLRACEVAAAEPGRRVPQGTRRQSFGTRARRRSRRGRSRRSPPLVMARLAAARADLARVVRREERHGHGMRRSDSRGSASLQHHRREGEALDRRRRALCDRTVA